MQRHRSLHSSDMCSQGTVLDSELMYRHKGKGLEQGQHLLRRHVMFGVGRHGHVLQGSPTCCGVRQINWQRLSSGVAGYHHGRRLSSCRKIAHPCKSIWTY
jgi:hypothetical protein